VAFYYKPTPDTTPEQSPFALQQSLDQYIPANETLRGCIELDPALLRQVGGQIGTSENWGQRSSATTGPARATPTPCPPNASCSAAISTDAGRRVAWSTRRSGCHWWLAHPCHGVA
jgi:hypothetical protein